MTSYLQQYLFESDRPLVGEAPPDAPYGEYLFGEFRSKVFEEPVHNEKDTPEETKLWNALSAYYSDNHKEALNKMVPQMVEVGNKGWYSEFFKVKEPRAWRILVGLGAKDAQTITGNSPPEKLGVGGSGTLPVRGGLLFSSWSADIKAMERLYNQIRFQMEDSSKLLGYVVLVECEPDSNSFFFNLFKVAKYLVVGGTYDYQKEILAHGPVTITKSAYIRLDKPTHPNPISVLVDLLGKEPQSFKSYQEYLQNK